MREGGREGEKKSTVKFYGAHIILKELRLLLKSHCFYTKYTSQCVK